MSAFRGRPHQGVESTLHGAGTVTFLNIARRPLPAAEKRRRFLLSIANHSVAIAFVIMFMVPFFFILVTALMADSQVLTKSFWPHPFVWGNFPDVFRMVPFGTYLRNTVVYAGLSTIGTVASSIPVAYALSRMIWRGRQAAFLLVLSTLMLPSQVTIIPLYVIFVHLHWVGSLKPLIVPTFFGDAFTIFLLRQFFLTIPEELLDAARVDGGGEFQILTRVIIPLAKPAIMAVSLFQFLYSWNDFFNVLIFTNTHTYTLAVGLEQLVTTTHRSIPWNIVMAGSILFMMPVLIIFFLAQRAFIEGVTLTGLKG